MGAGAGMGDDRKIGKWVPIRWTNDIGVNFIWRCGGGGGVGGGFWDDEDDALLRRSALSEGLPRRHASELTGAVSSPGGHMMAQHVMC